MNCLIKEHGVEGYKYKKVAIPQLKANEVLVKITKVAVCGSDIALYKWNDVAKVIASLPFIPGHEAVGVVTEVGLDVSRLKIGDRVAVENHFYCGDCYQCRNDSKHICQNLSQYGHGKGTDQGGFAQYSAISEKYCYKLTTDITDEEAALLEPMGVAHQATERLAVEGEQVLVIGCGPVGNFAIACAKALGATKVIAADISNKRLELAKVMGADYTINSKEADVKLEIFKLTNGDGIGRICEASGNAMMLNNCFAYLRKGGRVALIGLPKAPLHVDNVLQDIIFKSLTLVTVHGRLIFHTWEQCEQLIHEKKVDASQVISHRFKMSDHKEVFRVLLSGEGLKIVVDPQQ